MKWKEWTEQEYLGLYDRAIWGKGWLVYNHEDNSAITLADWIRR